MSRNLRGSERFSTGRQLSFDNSQGDASVCGLVPVAAAGSEGLGVAQGGGFETVRGNALRGERGGDAVGPITRELFVTRRAPCLIRAAGHRDPAAWPELEEPLERRGQFVNMLRFPHGQ